MRALIFSLSAESSVLFARDEVECHRSRKEGCEAGYKEVMDAFAAFNLFFDFFEGRYFAFLFVHENFHNRIVLNLIM